MHDSPAPTASEALTPEPRPTGRRGTIQTRRKVPETIGLLAFLLGEIVFFSITSKYFLSWENWVNILTAVAITGVLATAGTLLLVAGQFDLSVGSGVAFVSAVLATQAPHGLGIALLLAIGAGLGIGVLNGFLVTVIGVNALIATIGTMAIFRGLTLVIGNGQDVFVSGFGWADQRPIFNVPLSVITFVLFAVLAFIVMRYTVYGRKMYAIGANRAGARLVGIRVNRALFLGFVLSGACIVMSGLIVTSQLGESSGTTGTGLEISVVTAVILGGTSLSGGIGTIQGTITGLLIVGVLTNGLTLLNVSSFWQQVATGILLIAAVAFDRLRQTVLVKRA